MQLLRGKKALVTGGTSGIGKEIALTFARQGADVIIFGTSVERGEQVLKELQQISHEQKFAFYSLDVSKKAAVDEVLGKILGSGAIVDILVNNAGITRDGLLMKMSEEDWDQVIAVNLKSIYNLCQALVRLMIKARKGHIINISSVVGLTGNAGQANYAASKAGIIGFTKALAKELASRNICVNCIAPGFIATPMTDVLNETQKQATLAQIPMQRLGKPEEIANVALFLASSLSSYITGQVLAVDGGMVM
jgi:3-oxoacyl-[acyl-carrier protein] reductase